MAFGDVIQSAACPGFFPTGAGGKADVVYHCDPATQLIYELSTTDLSVVRSEASPGAAPIAVGGDTSVVWHTNVPGLNVTTLYQLDPSDFSAVNSADSPGSHNGGGIGGDTTKVWYSDYVDDLVYELDPTDFSVVQSASAPNTSPLGFGGDAADPWSSDDDNDTIYQHDPSDLSVLSSVGAPGSSSFDIGGDDAVIWFVDNSSGTFYQLDTGGGAVTYDLVTHVVGSGSVVLDPAGGTYAEDTEVELSGDPDTGWAFSAWSGDLVSTDNPDTIVMDGDKDVTANFIQLKHLVVTTSGRGNVAKDPDEEYFDADAQVELTATPVSGWIFSGWSGSVVSLDNPITVTMDDDKTIVATFLPVLVPEPDMKTQGKIASIAIEFDGDGSPLSTNDRKFRVVPFDCWIDEHTLVADQDGDLVIDIWKTDYDNYPGSSADSITNTDPPTISSGQKDHDEQLAGWTREISEGDILVFNVDSCSAIIRAMLSLRVRRR